MSGVPSSWLVRRLVLALASLALLGGVFAVAASASPTNSVAPSVSGDFSDGGTLTAQPGTWSSGVDSYQYQWDDCPSYSKNVGADIPAGYWRLDDSADPSGSAATAVDYSRAGHNGTYQGGPTLGAAGVLAGDSDAAVSFDGSSQYVSLTGSYPTGRNTVTLEAWYRPSALPAQTREMVLGYGDTSSAYFYVGVYGPKLTLRYGSVFANGTTTLTTNSWYYIVAVDTGTALNVYLNGSSTPEITISNPTGFSKTGGGAQIGQFSVAGGGGSFAHGTIDEAAIYPSALSTSQMAAHYAAATSATGSACTAISGATSQVYLPQSSDVGQRIRVDVSAHDSTGWSSPVSSSATIVQGGGPVNVVPPQISGTPSLYDHLTADEGLWSGPLSQTTYQWQLCGYQTAVLNDSPLSYYRLGEASGTSAADLGSNHLSGTYAGSPALGQSGALSGDPNTSVGFNGSTQQYATFPATNYPTGRSPVTVELWVKLPASLAGASLGGYGATGDDSHSFRIAMNSSGKPEIVDGTTYVGNTTMKAGDWYQLVAVDDGTNFELYVNGSLDSTFSPSGSFAKQAGLAAVAERPMNTGPYFGGNVDEFSVYGEALTRDQVYTHYEAGVQEQQGFGCRDIDSIAEPDASGTFNAMVPEASYAVTAADTGAKLRIAVTATNADGSTTVYSNMVSVTSEQPVNTLPPSIDGTPAAGDQLTVDDGQWAGEPTTFTEQWNKCTYENSVLAEDPGGYWRLGDDPNQLVAADASGNRNDATVTELSGNGTPNTVLGAPGALIGDGDTAVQLDGATELQVQDAPSLDSTSGYSIEGWFKPTSPTPPTSTLDLISKQYGENGWTLSENTAGKLVWEVGAVTASGSHSNFSVTSSATMLDPSQWYYVVATATGTEIDLYVNGAAPAKTTFSGTLDVAAGPTADENMLYIGSGYGATKAFNGSIDEVAYYPTALGQSDVTGHYGGQQCAPVSGATSSTYTAPDAGTRVSVSVTASNDVGQTTASSPTVLITSNGGPVNTARPAVDGTLDVGSQLTTDNGVWSSSTPLSYSYQWQRCTYEATILQDAPAGYWPMDEQGGPTVGDVSSGKLDATASGVNFGVDGALADGADTAIQIGGGGSGVEVPDGGALEDGDVISVEAWVQTSVTGSDQDIVDKGWVTSTNNGVVTTDAGYRLRIKADGHISFGRSDGAIVAVSTPTFPADGQFHQIVAERNGSSTTMKIYLDGVDVTGSITGPGGSFVDTKQPLEIGRVGSHNGSGPGANDFQGAIDQLAIYPTVLTSQQVNAHYQAAQAPCSDISGETQRDYTVSSDDVGNSVRAKVTATDGNSVQTTASSLPVRIGSSSDAADGLEPVDGARVQTLTPLLDGGPTSGVGDPLVHWYDYEVSNSQTFATGYGNWVKSSDWTMSGNYTVPSGWGLKDGNQYWWRVRSIDLPTGQTPSGNVGTWIGPNGFTVDLAPSGAPDYWAMWRSGPLAVNLMNGNLVFAAPAASAPTATGSLSMSFTYNSLDTQNHNIATGWIASAGISSGKAPTLVDYGALGGEDIVVVTWPDGLVSVYNHDGNSSSYESPPGDLSKLHSDGKNPPGSYTLTAADGTIYTYGPADPSTGQATIQKTEIVQAQPGKSTLTYTLDGSDRVTKVQDDATGRSMTVFYPGPSCSIGPSGCPITVTEPDGRTWTYMNLGATTSTISDNVRTLYQLTYDSNHRLIEIQNADDLDATHASAGYNGAHAITISYDASGRVAQIQNGPITGQSTASVTSFAYHPGDIETAPTQAVHTMPPDGYPWDRDYGSPTSQPVGTQRAAAGYTVVTPPNLQATGGGVTTYYDGLNQPMETIDAVGRVSQEAYDKKHQLIWTEDPAGNPTDTTYDQVTDQQTKVQIPQPSSGAGRPTTTYRYDERTVGTSSQPGLPLTGLQGGYYTNQDVAGRPTASRTDANVDFDWGAGGPAILPGTTSNFSARWEGLLDVPKTGTYTFIINAEGTDRLSIDDQSVISDWTVHSLRADDSQEIALTKGRHKIDIDYGVTSGTAEVNLEWRCAGCNPAIPKEVIPTDNLLPNWGNTTTVVDPVGRVAFSHFLNPQLAQPDYTLALLDTNSNDTVGPSNDPTTSFAYDSYGRVTKKVMPKGNTGRTIDATTTGNLSGAPDNRYATTYSYYAATDTVNGINQAQQLKMKSPHGLANTSYTYDADGMPLATTNGRGTTTYAYDSEERLVSEQAPGDTQATTFTYDPSGAQLTETDASGVLSNQYDEAGRTLQTTDSFGATATFTYDLDGDILSRTATPSGGTPYRANYTYDTADELATETDPTGSKWTYCYDNRGNLQGTQYPNNTYSWIDTNAAGWTDDLLNQQGTLITTPGACPSPPAQSSPSIADYVYQYNQAGQKTEEVRDPGGAADTTDYVYDNLGRLSQVTLPSGTVRQYTYDLDSNRLSTADNGTTTATYTYDPSATPGVDELSSVGTTNYSYNSDGEVTSYGGNTLNWDGWQRLAGGTFNGTAVAYTYDPSGALRTRTSGSTVTDYLLGDLFETDGVGALTTSYTDGPAGDLAQYQGPPATPSPVSYLYYNGHGDLAATADASGNPTGTPQTYDPFGAPLATQPTNTTEHLFTGRWDKQYDTSSNLILMGARPYDPSLGRFLAVDPVDGGSLNNYDYAGQDPVNNFDLNGTCFRDSATAAQLDMDVAGSDRALCEEVAQMYLGCVSGYEAMNPTDISDAQIWGICWGAVDAKLGKKHKHLWRQEPLRNGKPFDPVEAFCGKLGTDKYNLHEEVPKPKTVVQAVLCALYELPTGVRWTGNGR